jgi:hypothetical protein
MHRLSPAILALVALVSLSGLAHAQDKGSISGKVSDKKTGHALPFATVTVVGAQRGGLTDSEGQFLVTGVPVGTWEVRVQFLGYRPESSPQVVVTSGKATVVNFQLTDIVVHEEKQVEVSAERPLVEVRQAATIRSVSAAEIRNLPVQTIGDVLKQQAGVSSDADQIHVRGGRTDETIFVVNGVVNRDLVTGGSTAGQLNARSVAEVNVATGAYDVRYGNALSGVVEVKLKEGGDHFNGGLTLTNGSNGGRAFQIIAGGPEPILKPGLSTLGIKLPGEMSALVDLSGSLYDTRFHPFESEGDGFFERMFTPSDHPRLRSSYEDGLFGYRFHYGDFFSPSADNRWSARYNLTWKPSPTDKWNLNFSKRIAIDQGFSRSFINATGDLGDPAYPWQWARNITHAPTIFEDNVQTSLEWRRVFSTRGYASFQASRYFFAQRQDVQGKLWPDYQEPDDRSLADPSRRSDFFIDTGDDNTWQDRRTSAFGLQGTVVRRIRRNELEAGFEHSFQNVQYVTIEDPWVYDPDGLGGSHDLWRVHPWTGDLYVRDKIEYEGFTANLGLRSDYWFIGKEAERALADTSNENITEATRQSFHNSTHSIFGRRMKSLISPRVMVAHPITENSSFFFNYGEFTQIPSYRYVYSKLTSISSESFPLLGNPNLNPQVSVNYELGAKHQFLPTAAINATFFVKDIYDYPTATTFKRSQGTSLVDIFVYLNGHFARSKGFEVEIEKRRAKYWSGRLSYTFQQTKGKSSDPNEQKIVQETGGDAAETRLSESFVRWNRPHSLSANLDLRFDEHAPEHWQWLRNTGVNLYLRGESGRAYTPINLTSTQAAEPYSANALFQTIVDLKVNHSFKIGRDRMDLSLAGTNIFNNYLINRVDRVTGRGRVAGEGEYDRRNFPNVNDYVITSQVDDPSNYGPGAEWRLSLDYDF